MQAELITFKFPTVTGADEMSAILKTLQTQHFIEVRDAVIAAKYDDQHVDVRQSLGTGPGPGTAAGALTGGILGRLTGPAGAVVGRVSGALIGRAADSAHEPGFKAEELKTLVTYELRSGESILLVYADALWVDQIEQAVRAFDVAVYRRSSVAQPGAEQSEGVAIRKQKLDTAYAAWEETLARQRAEAEALRQRASAAVQTEQAAIRQQIEKGKAALDQFYQNMLHTLDVWQQQIEADINQLETKAKQATAQAKAELEQRLAAAREAQAALRAKVNETLAARLADLKGEIESLRSQAAAQRSELQSEWNARIAQLEAARQAEEQRLMQLREARGAAWDEMSKSIRQAIKTYEGTVRAAAAEFRKRA